MDILSATILECLKHDSFRKLFSPTTAPLPKVFKRPTSPGPSLAPQDYLGPGPRSGKAQLAFITRKMVPITWRASLLLVFLYLH